ncbi:carboxylate-amine ligase [Herpetosiphon llansteffanensis]|uniref:carboxylate-amine ligase n=1 Tax=Herpetosiphon llansteffanensis TaxID=2094568 RepID=UPI000D7C0966|nr:carboxylate-amine ligase [Herpetosiphon llansteffanensis]
MEYRDPGHPNFPFTIGIEEEYQIIDPETRELKSYITQILDEGQLILREQMKPEMHQSIVEVGTHVCRTVDEARQEIIRLRGAIGSLAASKGLRIAAAGTHPFSSWQKQDIYPHERYYGVIEEMQEAARRLLIFGMHVHIGMPDNETCIEIMNVARYFLPHLLALSTSSPFWMGRKTGFQSYRSIIFTNFPRTGIPDTFQSYAEFEQYINILLKTHSIDNGKKVWWDARPHPMFGTLEVRICDIATKVDEAIMIAGLIQAIFVKIYSLFRQNQTFRVYSRALINENKWRAARYGMGGKLIDFGKREELSAHDLMAELREFVDDVVDDLGSRAAIDYIDQVLKHGTSAERQLRTYAETGDIKAVVDQLIRETMEGVPVDQATQAVSG